jgi:hypothetical protein
MNIREEAEYEEASARLHAWRRQQWAIILAPIPKAAPSKRAPSPPVEVRQRFNTREPLSRRAR